MGDAVSHLVEDSGVRPSLFTPSPFTERGQASAYCVNFVSKVPVFHAELENCANDRRLMKRLDSVIAELEAARSFAVARFASEANMPVEDFLRHFRVVLENPSEENNDVSFRVEPREN